METRTQFWSRIILAVVVLFVGGYTSFLCVGLLIHKPNITPPVIPEYPGAYLVTKNIIDPDPNGRNDWYESIYTTPDTPDQVVKYYAEVMPNYGWRGFSIKQPTGREFRAGEEGVGHTALVLVEKRKTLTWITIHYTFHFS